MSSFDTISLRQGQTFMVTWDLGRRCNYDCSYCPVTRHDNFSPHATLNQLKANVDFLFEYIDTYLENVYLKQTHISFTGGEPTVNPNFIEFAKYLRQEYEKRYKDKWSMKLSLTTNGAMSEKIAQAVVDNIDYVTLSYHAEADDKLKAQVKKRMEFFAKNLTETFGFNTNVMFHAEYFEECKQLCKWLSERGFKFVPRVIGEEPDSKPTFAHVYNDEQISWLQEHWGIKVTNKQNAENKKLGASIGRPCCGARTMCLSAGDKSRESTFVDFRDFKGWHCSVNWFFLHLEQQTDSVFHHQTCQARFDGTRGPIGKISEGYKIIKDLKDKIKNKSMPTIICPKQTCSCGLCAPKSKYKEKYLNAVAEHINTEVLDGIA